MQRVYFDKAGVPGCLPEYRTVSWVSRRRSRRALPHRVRSRRKIARLADHTPPRNSWPIPHLSLDSELESHVGPRYRISQLQTVGWHRPRRKRPKPASNNTYRYLAQRRPQTKSQSLPPPRSFFPPIEFRRHRSRGHDAEQSEHTALRLVERIFAKFLGRYG